VKEQSGIKVRASGSGKEKSVARKPQTPRVRPHTSAHSAPRIPMAEQLRGLAPEGALGYRLVLPTRTPDDMPRLSPPLDATGYQGHYSLCPFQAPYDIRLMDGQTYRVVWIGASGEIIPPKTDGTIPGLHFFLTSSVSSLRTEAESSSCDSVAAGTESVKTEGSRSVPQTEVDAQRNVTPVLDSKQIAHYLTITERLTEALAEAIPALAELRACLAAYRPLAVLEATPASGIANAAPHELAAQESSAPSESITPPHSVTASESTQQSETPGDEIGVPPLQATSEGATADPPPQTALVASWDHRPLSAEEKQLVIRVALNEDKMTALCREMFVKSQPILNNHPSIDAAYKPKAEDCKDAESITRKAETCEAVSDLYRELLRVPLANPSGEYQQPRRIPSLSDFEKQRVRTAFRSGEQRAHFEYLMKRRDAIRLGSEEPPQPKSTSGFNREARRELEQFFRDTRTSALMSALLKQEWEAGKTTISEESFQPLSTLCFLPSGI
jgi:hypothetical protein